MNQQGQFLLKNQKQVYTTPSGPGDFFNALQTYGHLKKM